MRNHQAKPVPKVDPAWREQVKFKSEEAADIRRGTPGIWVENPPFRRLYIPGWMLAAEAELQECAARDDCPRSVVQIGPFWDAPRG